MVKQKISIIFMVLIMMISVFMVGFTSVSATESEMPLPLNQVSTNALNFIRNDLSFNSTVQQENFLDNSCVILKWHGADNRYSLYLCGGVSSYSLSRNGDYTNAWCKDNLYYVSQDGISFSFLESHGDSVTESSTSSHWFPNNSNELLVFSSSNEYTGATVQNPFTIPLSAMVEQTVDKETLMMGIVSLIPLCLVLVICSVAFWKGLQYLLHQLQRA